MQIASVLHIYFRLFQLISGSDHGAPLKLCHCKRAGQAQKTKLTPVDNTANLSSRKDTLTATGVVTIKVTKCYSTAHAVFWWQLVTCRPGQLDVLCCAVLCCAALCCAVLCYAVLCCAALCCDVCAVLCCAVPCRAVPCCAGMGDLFALHADKQVVVCHVLFDGIMPLHEVADSLQPRKRVNLF